ncbi:MAG: hypothetical protein EBR94_01215 [Bacteroidetes bacterium]|nr:hypothetical protein [Bacteroidota bacterium]
MPQSFRLKKAFRDLKKSNEFLENVNSHIEFYNDIDQSLEKSLGKNRAPQKRPTKITSSVAFEGHIGTGIRPSSKSKMANKILSSLTNNAQSNSNNNSFFPPIMFSKPSKTSENITTSWENHPDCSVGSFAFVQHPHKHEFPVWTRIVSIGKHGIRGSEASGDTHNVRWPNILEIQSAIGHGIHPGEDKEVVIDLHKLGAPIEHEKKLSHSELMHAEEYLRKLNLPIISDIIHSELEDSGLAYDELKNIHAPLDPIAMTEDISGKNTVLPAHLKDLINELSMMGKPINVEKLSKLPKKDILKVLNHYFKDLKI